MHVPDSLTIGQAAERLGLSPLKTFFLLRLHLGSESERVADSQMRILAEKLGVEISEPSGESLEALLGSEADPNPHRRVTRYLLAKLQRQHRWWPNNCISDSSLRHGVSEHEKGLVRDARDLLIRCGWMKVQTVRHKVTESNVGLNPDYREAIISFISTGDTKEQTVVDWLGQ